MINQKGIVFHSIEDEETRLAELYELDVILSPPEESLDRMTRLVSSIFKTPIALISFVTSKEQWFKSCVGLPLDLADARGTEREASFCQYAVAEKQMIIVENALDDERFVNNRLVTRENGIRFYAGAPLKTSKNNILGTLCIMDTEPREFNKEQAAMLQEFANIVIHELETRAKINQMVTKWEEIVTKNKQLKELTIVDTLTSIFNRRYFDESITIEMARARRQKQPLSLIMIDIDYFKNYNDTYGHIEGDECLKKVTQAIRNVIRRPPDVLARYGGEEFAMLLPNTDFEGAEVVAEKIKIAVEELAISHEQSSTADFVTVSQGYCTICHPESIPENKKIFINIADMQLYQSKDKGRNCTSGVKFSVGKG